MGFYPRKLYLLKNDTVGFIIIMTFIINLLLLIRYVNKVFLVDIYFEIKLLMRHLFPAI